MAANCSAKPVTFSVNRTLQVNAMQVNITDGQIPDPIQFPPRPWSAGVVGEQRFPPSVSSTTRPAHFLRKPAIRRLKSIIPRLSIRLDMRCE